MQRCLFVIALFTAQYAMAQTADSTAFPGGWTGNWTGTLNIYSNKGPIQSVPMAVEIFRLDTSTQGRYAFTLMYGSRAFARCVSAASKQARASSLGRSSPK